MADEPHEPPPKKIKSSKAVAGSVLEKLWQNRTLIDGLKPYIEHMKKWDNFCLCMLEIKYCNAEYGYSFSDAVCDAKPTVAPNVMGRSDIVEVYQLTSVFTKGMSMLTDFVDRMLVPEKTSERLILEKLLKVVENISSIEKDLAHFHTDVYKEVDWTLAVTEYLLKNLSMNGTYIIDNHYQMTNPKGGREIENTGMFGDTSIGNPSVWHGYVDILLGSIPVSTSSDEEENEGNLSAFEVKRASCFPEKCKDQLIAQTVVFSFLQNKKKKHNNCLVPTVGISRDEVKVFLYDCENDILLESCSLQLWKDPEKMLSITAVIGLWLAINHHMTCSGVTQNMKKTGCTAGFFKHAGEKLKIYQESLKFHCGKGYEVGKRFFNPKYYTLRPVFD